MNKLLIAAVMTGVVLSASAHAGVTLPKEDITGYAGACQPGSDADGARLLRDPLWVRNVGAVDARVICSPRIDTSQNGTTKFGALFHNTRDVNIVVTCVGRINQVSGGSVSITRSVLISPKKHQRIAWEAGDLGLRKTFIGGQAGFSCSLPPGVALQWVWTQAVAN